MANIKFTHVGMTVMDLDKMTDFYVKYFGFTRPERTGRFDETYIANAPTLYRQPEGVYTDSRMLTSDNGLTLELFRFSNVEMSPLAEWHKTGFHHIAFTLESVLDVYEALVKDGIECFYEPRKRRDSEKHILFFQDPEGNMVEIWDE